MEVKDILIEGVDDGAPYRETVEFRRFDDGVDDGVVILVREETESGWNRAEVEISSESMNDLCEWWQSCVHGGE